MRTRRLLLISCAPRRGRSRATPRPQVGAESPAGRAGEAARRTVPGADHPARYVRAWRPWGVFVP